MGRKRFEYEIRGYRYAPESFRAFKGLPGQKMEQISLSGEQRRKMGYLCGIVKKTAHPTCPVMPPVLVLTATVSA